AIKDHDTLVSELWRAAIQHPAYLRTVVLILVFRS
ncbi:MAG: hypothetical protein ACI9LU_001630, partial [Polaribacter sp.]